MHLYYCKEVSIKEMTFLVMVATMLFSIFGESCTEKDLYQHVECEQHE